MGRKRQFDEEQVLTKLLEHFWMYGYGATKVDELAELTGLTKSSLYNAFGNKEVIFTKVVDFYVKSSLNNMAELDTNKPLSVNLYNMLSAEFSAEENPLMAYGCLMTNSIAELSFSDPKLHGYVLRQQEFARQYFKAFFMPYIESGRIKSITLDELTDTYMTFRMGLKIQSREPSSSEAIESSISVFVRMLQGLEE